MTHSEPGSPVRVEVASDTPDVVRVRVHNRGEPIAPELLPLLFDPFRRGAQKAGGSRVSAGLGLGLYIANTIARAHAGSITVASDAEHGTTFTVTLPRVTPQSEE